MNPIAIFYNNTNIYYSTLIILGSIVAAFVLSLSIYVPKHKYTFPIWIYTVLATALSILFSRIIHWYCNMESYPSFLAAITNWSEGDYCISGVLLGIWLPALLLSLTKAIENRYELLDAVAPGLAFVLAMVRFSHIFSNSCRGKIIIENPSLCHLPLASGITSSDGKITYQLASFFLSFIVLLIVAIVLLIFRSDKPGFSYTLFLTLFSAEEVIIDSTRNDASHLFFSGEALANLNKGASFMGLSQIVSAVILTVIFITGSSRLIKENDHRKKVIPARFVLYILGLIIAGVCEYLVQRFTSLYLPIYAGQISGIIMMIIGILLH